MRPWDPNAWDKDPQKWGSAGLIWNGTQDPRSLTNGTSGNGWNFDPKYVRQVVQGGGDGEASTGYEATDYLNGLLGGKVQVRDRSRLIDENAVVDGGGEVGWLTAPSNYRDDTDWVDKAFEIGAFAGFGGPTMLHALGIPQGSWAEFSNHFSGNGASPSGLSGGDLPHGTEMPNTYSPGANPTSFYEPLGPNGLTGGDLPYGTEMPNTYAPGVTPSGAPSSGLLGGMGDKLSGLLGSAMKNPLQALGLLQMAGGLLGGRNTGTPVGASGGFGSPMQLGKSNTPWKPNAHTAAQIQNFKFTGGR